MGIKTRIRNTQPTKDTQKDVLSFEESLFDERDYRADRLVEKWSKVPEIGKGIKNMPVNTARNLAILLENQARSMRKMNEAQMSSNFYGQTPENMLRIIRLSYPNSIRGQLFDEMAMETANDSIKYIKNNYKRWNTDQRFDTEDLKYKFDDEAHANDVMYESTESRYATEMVNATVANASNNVTVSFKEGPFGSDGSKYIDGFTEIYAVVGGRRVALAMQAGTDARDGRIVDWMFNPNGAQVSPNLFIRATKVDAGDKMFTVTLETKTTLDGTYTPAAEDVSSYIKAVGRYDSEQDLQGDYLGDVEITMASYHFRPRPHFMGVSWTHMTELVLDTSFGVSAEDTLMDSAAQEIKKTLDFQSIKYADHAEQTSGYNNRVAFDALAVDGGGIKDSYFHTAQLITQAIDRVGDRMFNEFLRGGVTAIVGGPAAINYLKLNKEWSDRGRQPAIGGHKVGELGNISVFKVPSSIIPDNELLTTWKNPAAEGDVSVAIGTLLPFYSTGAIQRKTLYKEAAIARYEDIKALNPQYLGRVVINNIREISGVNA